MLSLFADQEREAKLDRTVRSSPMLEISPPMLYGIALDSDHNHSKAA